jgi:hypothetical protein
MCVLIEFTGGWTNAFKFLNEFLTVPKNTQFITIVHHSSHPEHSRYYLEPAQQQQQRSSPLPAPSLPRAAASLSPHG